MSEANEIKCRVCGQGELEHQDLEARKMIHHKFSTTGSLERIEEPTRRARPRQEVMVVPGVDITLRTVLIQKGILSESDFIDAGAYGGLPGADRAPRAQPSAEGSVRPSPEHP